MRTKRRIRMIRCTKCTLGVFVEKIDGLKCNSCGFEILVQDNFIAFHPELSGVHSGLADIIFEDVVQVENKHFWWHARKNYIKKIFGKYVKFNEEIIEIGAGTGDVAKFLFDRGYKNISVGEVHLRGLKFLNKEFVKKKYQFDLTKVPFYEHFDVVCMFDVLEHIDDDELAIRNVFNMLKPNGKIVITVPAHKWLWCNQDRIASHRRRYEIGQLVKMLHKNGFEILKSSAFFISLLPFMFLRTVIDSDRSFVKNEDYKNRFKVHPFINFVLKKILNLEVSLILNTSLKYGGSILVVAQKSF